MSSVRIPTAVVFGYKDYKNLAFKDPNSAFVLFGRTPLGLAQYPQEYRKLLTSCTAISGFDSEGVVVDGKKQYIFNQNIGATWQVIDIKVVLTRFWACSTAVIKLACPILDPEFPVYPPPVYPEQPISIALGYTSELGGVTVDATDTLQKVFTGYVDTVSLKLTSKRVIAIINLRDSIRFLVDNKITRMFSLQEISKSAGDTTVGNEQGVPSELNQLVAKGYYLTGPRDAIIQTLIVDGAGYWASALEPDPKDSTKAKGLDDTGKPRPEYQVIPRSRTWVAKSQRQGLSVKSAVSQFSNSNTTSDPQVYNVMNRFPIEVIKHLSTLEKWPMELYSDADGKIIWTRRETRLTDEKGKTRHPKDYWFRQPVSIEKSSGVHPIISASMEWSTIGTFNQFFLVNPNGQGGATYAASRVVNTKQALGFDMPVRTRFVYDDTLPATNADGSANQQSLEDEASSVLMAMLMIWGKDIDAGAVEVEGDPDIVPGDPLRVWNMGYYPPPTNLFRAEAVVHGYTATGPKKGFRTNIMFGREESKMTRGVKTAKFDDSTTLPKDINQFAATPTQ